MQSLWNDVIMFSNDLCTADLSNFSKFISVICSNIFNNFVSDLNCRRMST